MTAGPGERLRRYAISGRIPRPLLQARRFLINGPVPPRLTIHLLAWSSYRLAKPELRVLRQFVDPQRDSIDVGANLGVHSYFLARWSRHVYTYEPNPELAAFLEQSRAGNVTLSPLALSDRAGSATLAVPLIGNEAVDPYASLEERVALLSAAGAKVRRHEVETQPLDALDHTNIGFITIDVEGHEEAVIEGATETLRRERPALLIEIVQQHTNSDVRDVLRRITSLGYRGSFLEGGTLRPLEEFSVEEHHARPFVDSRAGPYVENFFFTPRTCG